MFKKISVLLIGGGGVGAMAAYNLEAGGQAAVTMVLRSNFKAAKEVGFTIRSLDHGDIEGWRPTKILNSVPNVSIEGSTPYDMILVTTKNIPDVSPTNGLNIEIPVIAAFPSNPIVSGVSLIGATETSPGCILHDDQDRLLVGAFTSPSSLISMSRSVSAAKKFIELYSASRKVSCTYETDVGFVRLRKLIYNVSYNGACAITGVDTSRMRMAQFPIEEVIRPLIYEVWEIAKAKGHDVPEAVVQDMIDMDPWDTYFKPSMLQDAEKENYIEFENIVGEPLRDAEKLGIPVPELKMLYGLLKIKQFQIKESKGVVSTPFRTGP